MFSILYTEILKLKRQKILILAPICALITAVFGYIGWFKARPAYGYGVDWYYLFPMTEQVATSGLLMVFIVIFSAFIFLNEYQNSCCDMIFSYPYRCYRFIIAKLFISFVVSTITVYITYGFTFIMGIASLHETPNYFLFTYHIKMFFIIAILCFALAPLFILMALLSRGYILPLAAVILIIIWNFSLSAIIKDGLNNEMGFLPWNIPNNIIQSLQPYLSPVYKLARINDYTPYLSSISVTFIIPLMFLFIYFVKTEHAKNN